MHLFEKNIKDLGLEIPEPPSAVANYVPYKIADNLVFISGQAPSKNGQIIYSGKVGDKISDKEAILAAELCCLNIISILKQSIAGDWDRLDNFIKIGGFVNCNPNYSNQPIIINGAYEAKNKSDWRLSPGKINIHFSNVISFDLYKNAKKVWLKLNY